MSPKNLIFTALLAGFAVADVVPSSAAAAQVTTMPVFLAVNAQSLVAQVVTANPTFTSYSFNCAPGTDATNCDFYPYGGNLTVAGKSTYIMSVNGAAAGTPDNQLTVACTSLAASTVVCSETGNSMVQGPGGQVVASTTSVVFTENTFELTPLTITAGQAFLAAASSEAASATAASNEPQRTSPTTTLAASATGKGAAGRVDMPLIAAGLIPLAAVML